MASITQRFLVPVSTVSARNAWHNDRPPISDPKTTKMPGWVLPKKLGGDVRHSSWNPYPISDQNLWFSLPYFRPDQKFDTLFQPWSPARVTGACDKLLPHVHGSGVNIKREMVLSPNDEEVANSSKKHYPIQDLCANHTYFRPKWSKLIPYFRPKRLKEHSRFGTAHTHIAYIRDFPPGRKTCCRLLVSLLTQARLIRT